MEVVEGVVDRLPLAPVPDETGSAEQGELVAHRGLAHAEGLDEVADAELAGAEGREDPEPARVGEDLEELAEFGEPGGVGRGRLGRLDPVLVDLGASAGRGLRLDVCAF